MCKSTPREEEPSERVTRDLASPASTVIEHPIQVLGRPVIARVAGVSELVGVPVQGARSRERLVRPTTIYHVHQVGLDPPFDDVPVIAEADEHLRVVEILAGEVVDSQLVFPLGGREVP